MKASNIEFGDFQTPPSLATEVCRFLANHEIRPAVVVEPTVGKGSFLVAAAVLFPHAQLRGSDINRAYVKQTEESLEKLGVSERAVIKHQDFFQCDWESELAPLPGELLIVGNPPWVTNAAIAAANGTNLPMKENFLGLKGIAARTGKSNFDISEWMLICLIRSLRGRTATIAMLCKTATARKALRFAWQNDGRVAEASIHLIDAKKHFGASVDACLLFARMGKAGPAEAKVFNTISNGRAVTTMGLAGKDLVSDIETYRGLRHLEGLCPYQWRSGVKHDCASVMELSPINGKFCNKLGEEVSIEQDYLFPLLKCSDLANGRARPERLIVVTQRRVGEDTNTIATQAPRTWDYLNRHRDLFEARKSSIYTGRISFALFGVGDYSFAPWKVAVSALHRTPRFVLVSPANEKPVLFDDTCYFLAFDTEHEARIVAQILNSEECRQFLSALSFTDSKRPITVELLQRLNIRAIAEDAGLIGDWSASRNRDSQYSNESTPIQPEFVMENPSAVSRPGPT
jgi:hypothetical protein